MTKSSNLAIPLLFIILLGLFFLYLIVNYIMDQNFVVETMTTSLPMGKVTQVSSNN